ECVVARDGSHGECRPMQSRPADLRRTETRRYREAVRKTVAMGMSVDGTLRRTENDKLRLIVRSPLQFLKTFRCGKLRIHRLLYNDNRARHEPAAVARARERLVRHSLAIGRIAEHEVERLVRMRL